MDKKIFCFINIGAGDDDMNTSGFIRGYMAKNMKAEEFIEVITKALSREFEEKVELKKENNNFKILMKDFEITISKDIIEKMQKDPYSIDKYILDEFSKQGFNFDKNRSQYIKYCYGKYDESILN